MTALRVGTPTGRLAVAQTEWVVEKLHELNPSLTTEIVVIKTPELHTPAAANADMTGFAAEIENALLAGEVDLAVQDLKKRPYHPPQGLQLAAIPERLSPFDAFVSNQYRFFADLPKNARIGVGNARHQAELLRFRADLDVVAVPGDLFERLAKLDDGELDAVIIAKAALDWLSMTDRSKATIGINIMLPSAGQGAVGLVTRIDDEHVNAVAVTLHDEITRICVLTEHAFMQALGNDYTIPAAALAEACCGNVILHGALFEPDGHIGYLESMVSTESAYISGAQKLARRILEMGGAEILTKLTGISI